MAIKTKRQARKARKVANKIENARSYARIDAASVWWGWIDVNNDKAFFSSNGRGGQDKNPRVSAAYVKEFNKSVAFYESLPE